MSGDPPGIDLPPQVLEFIETHRTLTLATASPAAVPHAGTLLYVNDGPTLYFWTRPETTIAQHVERNPSVAFAIDEGDAGVKDVRGVQGTGTCRVLLRGDEVARIARLFGEKFPDLSPGNTLSISFFRVTPADIDFIDNRGLDTSARPGAFGAEFRKQRAYSIFGDLPREEVDEFVATLQTIELAPGDVVVRAGTPADKYLIVLAGRLEVRPPGSAETRSLGPGDLFGELAILRDTPRRATVVAVVPSTLLALDRDTFKEITARALGTTHDFDDIIRRRLGTAAQA
jgi:uncharacterized protein YhbP (UPF0306 family)